MQRLQGLILIFALVCFAFPAPLLRAQTTNVRPAAYTIDRYLNIRSATSPTFSPDGGRVAFLTNITGTSQVWAVSAQGGWPDQLTAYEDRIDFVRWSPDGSGLVFAKSRRGDENAQ